MLILSAILTISGPLDADTKAVLKFASGYPVALIHNHQDDLQEIVRAAEEAEGKVVLFPIDLTGDNAIVDVFKFITDEFGQECAAAIFQIQGQQTSTSFLKQNISDLQKEAVIPIKHAYAFAQHALPLLQNHQATAAHPPTLLFSGPSTASYYHAVNENALVALSRSLGREYGPKRIHVSHVKFKKTAGNTEITDELAAHVSSSHDCAMAAAN